MGCGGSKAEDSPLVNLCRKRKQLIKAAADHRYALAEVHLSYFTSLKDVGDALCRFVEEELVVAASSSSSSGTGSPVLTLPSGEGKHNMKGKKQSMRAAQDKKMTMRKKEAALPSSSSSLSSISGDILNRLAADEGEEGQMEESHLHDLSDSEVSSLAPSGHIEIENGAGKHNAESHPKPGITYTPNVFTGNPYVPYAFPYSYAYDSYYPSGSSSTYYTRKAPTAIPTVFYEEPKPNPIYVYGDFASYRANYMNAGYYGFVGNTGSSDGGGISGQQRQRHPPPPPTPPSPKLFSWDYLNPFEMVENNFFPEYYAGRTKGYGWNTSTSSPNSEDVREREGIPDLEEETENEIVRESFMNEKSRVDEGSNKLYRNRDRYRNNNVVLEEGKGDNFGEVTSTIMSVSEQDHSELQPVEGREAKGNSPGSDASISNRREYVEAEPTEFGLEVHEACPQDIESPEISTYTVLSSRSTHDLWEAARKIKDEFNAATDYGKEVSLLLEAGKLPYRSWGTCLRVKFARFLYSVAPPISSSLAASDPSSPSSSRKGKITSSSPRDSWNRQYSGSLASTLDKLYVWEKKLYEEVKDEERLRVSYEKCCKKLKSLDERGADAGKIEATEASIRKLLTKIDISIRAVEAISNRIHRLREEELQPKIVELIYGLRKMWKSMVKCHQRQFQAILESRTQTLKIKTAFLRGSSVKATLALEMELLKWCSRLNQWIEAQRFYAESLNGWLFRCVLHEPEETPDGVVPFSPGKIGTPPVFVICHDWNRVMDKISESGVKTAMHNFVVSLQLWERQAEEERQRIKAEYPSRGFEKQIQNLREEKGKIGPLHRVAISDKLGLSIVQLNSDVSLLSGLKEDLGIKGKMQDWRTGHRETVKLVHGAASRSIQAGLIPIFEALESFASEAAKAYDSVRVQIPSGRGHSNTSISY